MERETVPYSRRESIKQIDWLFWDCDLEQLDLIAHRDFIIERILDRGTVPAVRWLFKTFGEDIVRHFLINHGHRLRRDVFHFWKLFFGLQETECTKKFSPNPNEMLWPY